MRTLRDMTKRQIEQAESMIDIDEKAIVDAKSKMDIEKLDNEYFENKAIIAIKQENINYWNGVKVMAQITLAYVNNYIEKEEAEFEEMMESVPTTI